MVGLHNITSYMEQSLRAGALMIDFHSEATALGYVRFQDEYLCQCLYCGTALPYPTECPGCGVDNSPAAIYREGLEETIRFTEHIGGHEDMYILLAEEADRIGMPERYSSFHRKELIRKVQGWKLSEQ